MTEIARCKVSLGFFGDGLDPTEVTAFLGVQPTHRYRKRDDDRTPQRPGSWRLHASERAPGDPDAQIRELLSGLTNDVTVWRELTTRFKARLFCGLFMEEGNEGVDLSPETLTEIGRCGLTLSLDIYDSAPA
jgi:hypothetical protein